MMPRSGRIAWMVVVGLLVLGAGGAAAYNKWRASRKPPAMAAAGAAAATQAALPEVDVRGRAASSRNAELAYAAKMLVAAESSAKTIKDPPARDRLSKLRQALIRRADVLAAAVTGEINPALNASRSQNEETNTGWAGLLAGAGAWKAAEAVANNARLASWQALSVVAEAKLRAKDRPEAVRLFMASASVARGLPIQSPVSPLEGVRGRYKPLLELLLAQREFKTAGEIVQALPDDADRMAALSLLASEAMAHGDRAVAIETLKTAQAQTIALLDQSADDKSKEAGAKREKLVLSLAEISTLQRAAGVPSADETAQKAIAAAGSSLFRVASVLCDGGDLENGGSAFNMLAAAKSPGQMAFFGLMRDRAEAGDYQGAADMAGDNKASLGSCMRDGRTPQNATEAHRFLKAFEPILKSENLDVVGKRQWTIAVALDGSQPDRLEKAATGLHSVELWTAFQFAAEHGNASLAKQFIELVPESVYQNAIRLTTAAKQMKDGDLNASATTAATIKELPHASDVERQCIELAIALAKAGRQPAAIDLAAKASPERGRGDLMKVLAEQRRPDDVLKVAAQKKGSGMLNPDGVDFALGTAYARLGKWKEATDALLRAMPGYTDAREHAVDMTAFEWAKADPGAAGTWATGLEDPLERTTALIAVARATLSRLDTRAELARQRSIALPPNPILNGL